MKSSKLIFAIIFFLVGAFQVFGATTFDAKLLSSKIQEQVILADEFVSDSACEKINTEILKVYTEFQPSKDNISTIVEKADKLLELNFQLKIKLKNMYNALPQKSVSCINSMRKVFPALRAFSDYVGYIAKVSVAGKYGLPDGTYFNDEFLGELKSGDVILSRGNVYSSAAIARITDIPAQFSHLAILYVDPKTKEKFMVEAHIEQGSVVSTWDQYWKDGKTRALVMRQKDEKLAADAAEKIYQYVKAYQQKHHKNIPYDFAMDSVDHRKLFCSEVVEFAYELASEGKFKVPAYRSQSQNKNVIKKAIGIENKTELFAPADMEVDPRFKIVAEYTNVEIVNQSWSKDAVLSFLYSRWNKNEITLKPTIANILMVNLAIAVRNTPLIGKKLLYDKVPKKGPYSGIMMMMNLNIFFGRKVSKWLNKLDQERASQGLLPMNYAQLAEYLESHQDEFLKKFRRYLGKKK